MNNDPYKRALEAYEEARQMVLDLNQPYDQRAFWEDQKRKAEGAIHELFDYAD